MDNNDNLHLPGEDPTGDEPYGEGPYEEETPATARRRWPWAAAVVVAALAAVAGGVAVAGNMGSNGPAAASSAATTPGTPTSATATAAPTTATAPAAAAGTPTPEATTTSASAMQSPSAAAGQWQTFTSADGRISFDHPDTWQVTQAPPANSGSTDVDVADQTGAIVASLHSGPSGGLGGACEGPVPYTVLDSVNVDIPYQPTKGSVTPRFTFRALQEADHVTASYGLTSSPAGQNGTTCMFYNVVNGPPDSPLFSFADTFQVNAGSQEQTPGHKGAKTFPTMDAAKAYMQTPEYLNAKRMITSLRVHKG